MDTTGVSKHTSSDDLVWYRRYDQEILLSDALDEDSGVAMSVGFARYGAGESNPWTVAYDEALVITRGRYSVVHDGVTTTAGPGEVIYLRRGTELVYQADEPTEVVYVTYPHWMAATERSQFADRLAEFQPDPDARPGGRAAGAAGSSPRRVGSAESSPR